MNVIQKKNKVIFNGNRPTQIGYKAALKVNKKASHSWTGAGNNFVYRKHSRYFTLNQEYDKIREE
jgi:hypothetical protein